MWVEETTDFFLTLVNNLFFSTLPHALFYACTVIGSVIFFAASCQLTTKQQNENHLSYSHTMAESRRAKVKKQKTKKR